MSQVAVARQLFGVQGTTLREKGGLDTEANINQLVKGDDYDLKISSNSLDITFPAPFPHPLIKEFRDKRLLEVTVQL